MHCTFLRVTLIKNTFMCILVVRYQYLKNVLKKFHRDLSWGRFFFLPLLVVSEIVCKIINTIMFQNRFVKRSLVRKTLFFPFKRKLTNSLVLSHLICLPSFDFCLTDFEVNSIQKLQNTGLKFSFDVRIGLRGLPYVT